jgi:hypothetical protein
MIHTQRRLSISIGNLGGVVTGILLEVDHLDVEGFQVNNGKDSWSGD